MALALKFNVCLSSDCKTLTFNETTGIYSSTNTGGYGAPNPLASATAATLTITKEDDTTVEFDLLAESFPSTVSTLEFEITGEDLGYGVDAKLPDGEYIFQYDVTISGVVYTKRVVKFFYCQVKCCIEKLFAKIADVECECTDKAVKKAMKGYAYLKALQVAVRRGNQPRFANLLKILQKICADKNCGC